MCKLLDLVKERAGLDSNNKVAQALKVSPELVSRWNTNKSEPNGLNTLKLMQLGNISRDEAIRLMQNGYSNVSLLLVTSLSSIALLALTKMPIFCILC